MRKLKVALINNVHYCKFPEKINSITEFVELLNDNYHSFVELETFSDEGCIPPFFVEEELKTEKKYWNPSHIRLVSEDEVMILPRCEYEEKLKKVVQEKCIHCMYYSEDLCEEDYKPYIEHIDLNGECYAFEKKK